MTKKPYTPTRLCPHRWCKPLHWAPAPFALAFASFLLWNSPIFLVALAGGGMAGPIMYKLYHYRPSPRSTPPTLKDVVDDIRTSPTLADVMMQDAKYEGTGWRMLEVRKGWARAAITLDIMVVLCVGLICATLFTNPAEKAQRAAAATIDLSAIVGMILGLCIMWLWLYVHKKATQPRKPKRVWVPAFLRTNT